MLQQLQPGEEALQTFQLPSTPPHVAGRGSLFLTTTDRPQYRPHQNCSAWERPVLVSRGLAAIGPGVLAFTIGQALAVWCAADCHRAETHLVASEGRVNQLSLEEVRPRAWQSHV